MVVVDDKSTDETLWRINAVAEDYPELIVIPAPVNRGKRHAMATGIAAADDVEIYVFIDSDSQVMPDAVKHHRASTSATRESARWPGTPTSPTSERNVLTRMQAMQYYIAFRIYKSAEALFGSVTCCSGCFSAYRRDAVAPGARCLAGPDLPGPALHVRRRPQPDQLRAAALAGAVCARRAGVHQRARASQAVPAPAVALEEVLAARDPPGRTGGAAQEPDHGGDVLPVDHPAAAGPAGGAAGDGGAAALHHELPYWYFGGVATIALIYGMYYRMNKPVKRWYQGIFFTLFYTIMLVLQMPYAMATIRDSKWGTR